MRAGYFVSGCVAFVLGVFTYNGCGGKVIQAQCAEKGQRYCVVTDYCCPTDTVCGTGQPTGPDGLVCAIGDCCPPMGDAGDGNPPPYIQNPDYPGEMTGSPTPPATGGVSAPPQPPQTRQ